MPLEYFPCYHSYLDKTAKLSDQELGRLFRALMVYSATGERAQLAGRESIAFDFIVDDMDRAAKAYEEKCLKNRENSLSGASKRKRKQATDTDRERPIPNDTKNKSKDKDKVNSPLIPPGGNWGFGAVLTDTFTDWLRYKAELGQAYQETGLSVLVEEVRKNAQESSEEAVAALLRKCMSSGWSGIIWDKLERPPKAPGQDDLSWMKAYM